MRIRKGPDINLRPQSLLADESRSLGRETESRDRVRTAAWQQTATANKQVSLGTHEALDQNIKSQDVSIGRDWRYFGPQLSFWRWEVSGPERKSDLSRITLSVVPSNELPESSQHCDVIWFSFAHLFMLYNSSFLAVLSLDPSWQSCELSQAILSVAFFQESEFQSGSAFALSHTVNARSGQLNKSMFFPFFCAALLYSHHWFIHLSNTPWEPRARPCAKQGFFWHLPASFFQALSAFVE